VSGTRWCESASSDNCYIDTDTDCLKPVLDWGKVDAVVWDLGDKVSKEIAHGPPQVIIGVEVDVPDITGWESFWP
jgi:hypothetical protein